LATKRYRYLSVVLTLRRALGGWVTQRRNHKSLLHRALRTNLWPICPGYIRRRPGWLFGVVTGIRVRAARRGNALTGGNNGQSSTVDVLCVNVIERSPKRNKRGGLGRPFRALFRPFSRCKAGLLAEDTDCERFLDVSRSGGTTRGTGGSLRPRCPVQRNLKSLCKPRVYGLRLTLWKKTRIMTAGSV